ncbi:MAG: S-layer homology domain-containing protein [Firmicutes bacterium]|nr:S-layer homology domain-containing protein [Bacillota bacterium]
MKKCLTILLCLCMVWTMTPLGVWAEPVVDNEAGTITVTTLEEMIAALNDAEGPDTIRVEQTINISKEEDGFRTVVVPAGKTLWLKNADCLQFQFARCNVRVEGGGGKLAVHDNVRDGDITLFSGAPDDDAVFQIEEGWAMWCPNLGANDPENPDKYTQSGDDKWIYITGNMWFEPGRVTVQGEVPYYFAESIIVDTGITMTVKEGETFRPGMFAEIRGTLVIPEGSTYDIYHTEGGEQIERRPWMTIDSNLDCKGTLEDYGCEVFLQNAGEDFADPNEIRTDGETLAIDPGTKNGFSLERIELETSWTDRQEAVSAIVPQWDPEWVLVDHGGSQLKTGAYTFPDPRCPLTVTLHWRYDGSSADSRSAELRVNTDWDAEEPLEEGEDYTINWYEKGGDRPIATGDFVFGLDPAKEYEVEVLLSEEAAHEFRQEPRMEVPLTESHNILSTAILLFQQIEVGGVVTDGTTPLEGASVTLRQINGQYTNEKTVKTDGNGAYSFGKVPGIKSTLLFALEGFFDERLAVENWEEFEGDPSAMTVEMEPLTTDRIEVSKLMIRTAETYLQTTGFAGGYASTEELPVVETPGEFPDYLDISVYKKGEDPAGDREIEIQAEYPYLYLNDDELSPGDVLEVRIGDPRGFLADYSGEVTLDENRTGQMSVCLLEKGKLRVYVHRGDPGTEAAVMVFDADGKPAASYAGRMGYSDRQDYMMSLRHIEAGTYTVVLMKKTRLLRAISSLSRLDELGLRSGSDYIRKNVTIKNGEPTDLEVDRIPETQIPSLVPEKQLSFTAGAAKVPVGNFVTLRASYDLGENENGEQIRFDIPEGLTVVNNSVTVDGSVHPYTYSSGVLRVSTNKSRAVVRFGVIPSRAGDHTVNGYLDTDSEETAPMGSVTLESSMTQISAPAKTPKREIPVSGTAPYGCEVTVYDNGEAVGTAVAKASGRWTTVIGLADAENTPVHRLTASFTYQGQDFGTDTSVTIYDPDYMAVTTVTMINTAHTEDSGRPAEYVSVFDFENDGPRPVYNYWPEFPTFTFQTAFSGNSSRLEEVKVITTDASGSETEVELSYDSASDTWVGTHDYLTGYEIPSGLRVEYVDPEDRIAPYDSEEAYIEDMTDLVGSAYESASDTLLENMIMSDFYEIGGGYAADLLNKDGVKAGTYRITSMDTTLAAFREAHSKYESEKEGDVTYYKASEGDSVQWTMTYFLPTDGDQGIQITRSIVSADAEITGEDSGELHGTLAEALYAAAGGAVRASAAGAAAENAVQAANMPGATLEDISVQLGGDLNTALEKTGAELREKGGQIKDGEKAMMDLCVNGGLGTFITQTMNKYGVEIQNAASDLVDMFIAGGLTQYVLENPEEAEEHTKGFLESWFKDFSMKSDELNDLYDLFASLRDLSDARSLRDIFYAVDSDKARAAEISSKLCWQFLNKWNHSTPNKETNGNQDPSGYVYEAVPSNRLEGVTATIYYKGEDGAEVEWPQEIADQYNPQTTDANGVFSWMVPQGSWKVKFSKEGYEDTDSTEVAAKIAADLPGYTAGWLPVPPPQTEVNVPMVSTKAPDVASVNAYEDGVRVEFTQYMKPDTVKVTVKMQGQEVRGTLKPVNAEADAAGENTYASVFRFVPAEGTKLEGGVDVVVDKTAANYAGTEMEEAYSVPNEHPVEIEPKRIAAPESASLKMGEEKKITITVTPAVAGELRVVSSSPSVLEVDSPVLADENGRAEITVRGKLPGSAQLLVSMYGTELDAQIKVTIGEEEGGDDPDNPPGGGGSGGGASDDPGTDPPEEDHDAVCPSKAFSDLDTSLWYHEGTDYVIENGIMNGTGEGIFEPNANMTRAMIVTILHRMEGEPAAPDSDFTDLTQDWYKAAVNWAAEKGIVNGYSAEKFGPNDPVTREQLAAILYRYAEFKGEKGPAHAADLSKYTDLDQVSDWAMDSMNWCVAAGLINGMSETTLGPKGTSTRAQVATIIMRLKTGG